MSGCGDDIGIGNGRGMKSRRNKTRNVSHVNHEICADGLGNFADALKIDDSRISRSACNNKLGLCFVCDSFKLVIVDEAVGVNAVRHEFIELSACVNG